MMANSAMVTLKGELLASRVVAGKKGKLIFHRVLVKDGFGISETVDIVSMKDGKKPGPQEFQVSVGVDRDKTNLRFFEGA